MQISTLPSIAPSQSFFIRHFSLIFVAVLLAMVPAFIVCVHHKATISEQTRADMLVSEEVVLAIAQESYSRFSTGYALPQGFQSLSQAEGERLLRGLREHISRKTKECLADIALKNVTGAPSTPDPLNCLAPREYK